MKRRKFLQAMPILAASPFAFTANSKEKLHQERHLIGLGTAACMLLNTYGNHLGFTSMTLIDSFPIRNQKESNCYIPFNCHLNQQIVPLRNSKGVQTPTLPLDPSIKNHLESLSGNLVFISGLGNGTGSILTQSLGTQYFHKSGSQRWIVTLPFEFEGRIKYDRAYAVLRNLMDYQDSTSFYNLDDIREKYGNLSIRSAYEKVDLEVLKLIDTSAELG